MTAGPDLRKSMSRLPASIPLIRSSFTNTGPSVLNHTVNKTALHPGGVQPHIPHTELEEELHETAHIDYDRVSIVRLLLPLEMAMRNCNTNIAA